MNYRQALSLAITVSGLALGTGAAVKLVCSLIIHDWERAAIAALGLAACVAMVGIELRTDNKG
jgi:VIT1/CCC1 family predicted Fe2+/Mn2+ transporter